MEGDTFGWLVSSINEVADFFDAVFLGGTDKVYQRDAVRVGRVTGNR